MPRVVAVFGATGTQGSAVVNALLEDKTFVPRAITRNASSDAAKALAARGAEVATGDLWDRESIKKALEGCEAVFGVTNYNDPSIVRGDTAGEIVQGKQLVDVAKEIGIKFFVWRLVWFFPAAYTQLSTIAALFRTAQNCQVANTQEYIISIAAVEDYLRASGLPNASIHTGSFAENIINFPYTFGKDQSGAYELRAPLFSPTKTVPVLWVEKTLGPIVLALLKHYQDRADEVLDKTFYVANAHITFPGFAEVLSKGAYPSLLLRSGTSTDGKSSTAIDKPVKFVSPPTTGVKEFDAMNEYVSEIGLFRDAVLPDPRLVALGVKFATLEDFAQERAKPHFA
ncbi:hypothetical protein HWV62_516 [Athelia sp. TMB]|nr:hypothetical protein HWV62_516 [Athelia sp. TMB]